MRHLLLVLALLLVLVGAGCGGGEGAEQTATVGDGGGETATAGDGDGETATAGNGGGEAATATCTGEGYTVEYPADWHQERCAYFDRQPFEVPEATEFFDVGVLVSREPVPLDVAAGDDRTRTVLEREEIEIAGHDAVRLEAESTGEGLLDRGVRFYQVLVSTDGETVFLSTYDLPGLDYERNKEAVDEFADGLRIEG